MELAAQSGVRLMATEMGNQPPTQGALRILRVIVVVALSLKRSCLRCIVLLEALVGNISQKPISNSSATVLLSSSEHTDMTITTIIRSTDGFASFIIIRNTADRRRCGQWRATSRHLVSGICLDSLLYHHHHHPCSSFVSRRQRYLWLRYRLQLLNLTKKDERLKKLVN